MIDAVTLDSATLATIASGFAIAGSLALLVRAILLQRHVRGLPGVQAALERGDMVGAGRRAAAILSSGPPPGSEAYLTYAAGRGAMAAGHYAAAASMLSRSCAALTVAPSAAERSGHAVPYDFDLFFEAQLFLGLALLQRGQLAAADAALSAALDVRTAGRDLDRATAMRHLAIVRRARNRLAEARSLAEESRALARTHGDDLDEALCLRALSQVDDAEGDWAGAAHRLTAAVEAFGAARRRGHTATGELADEAVTTAMLARAQAEDGRPEEATETLELTRRPPPRAPGDLAFHIGYFASAVHRLAGRPAEALEAARGAAVGYRAADILLMEQHAERQVGLAQAALGRHDEARSTLRAAAAALDSFGAAHEATLARDDLARLDGG